MKKITLFVVALALLFTNLSEALAQKKGKPLYTFPLGVQTYTYRNHLPKDVEGTLDRIQALGITEIEGGAPKATLPNSLRKYAPIGASAFPRPERVTKNW